MKEEIIVVKKLTLLRMFIVLALLLTIDMTSSYIAITKANVYEVNNLASKLFSFGLPGLLTFWGFGLFMDSIMILFIYMSENVFFKFKKQQFRTKIFYILLGMYTYVFINNLRVVLNLLF